MASICNTLASFFFIFLLDKFPQPINFFILKPAKYQAE